MAEESNQEYYDSFNVKYLLLAVAALSLPLLHVVLGLTVYLF